LILVPLAYIAALIAAAVTMSVALMGWNLDVETAAVALGLSIGLTLYGGAISFLPALAFIILAESFRWRSIIAYLAAGGLIGLIAAETTIAFDGLAFAENLRLITIASGFVGGAVYWLIAGKLAGLSEDAAA
jgi:hypothetical protein